MDGIEVNDGTERKRKVYGRCEVKEGKEREGKDKKWSEGRSRLCVKVKGREGKGRQGMLKEIKGMEGKVWERDSARHLKTQSVGQQGDQDQQRLIGYHRRRRKDDKSTE